MCQCFHLVLGRSKIKKCFLSIRAVFPHQRRSLSLLFKWRAVFVYLLLLPVSLVCCYMFPISVFGRCWLDSSSGTFCASSYGETSLSRFRSEVPEYSFQEISMQRCVVHWAVAPRWKSTQVDPRPVLDKGGHTWAGGPHTQFINITWCTMETLAAHSSLSKVCWLACQSHLWEGGMCGEYRRCCLFGSSEMWKSFTRSVPGCQRGCGGGSKYIVFRMNVE